jgi:hypothetical protein
VEARGGFQNEQCSFKDEAMKKNKWFAGLLAIGLASMALATMAGCGESPPKTYGEERQLFLPGSQQMVWAVAPTVNLSGERPVDPLLQSDLVFQQLQAVHGLTVIPVNRVAEIYAKLRINKVQTEEQATAVCQLLGCDGLVVPTVTIYQPYDPPKMGAALQLFAKPGSLERMPLIDPHQLERSPTPGPMAMGRPRQMQQAAGIFDAADGTVRDRVNAYSAGRTDPNLPFGNRVVYLDMDQYSAFVYHELISQLLDEMTPPTPGATPVAAAPVAPMPLSAIQANAR